MNKAKNNMEDVNNRLRKLENDMVKLNMIIENFMNSWGPEAERKRNARDNRWDEMVRVLSVQNRLKDKSI